MRTEAEHPAGDGKEALQVVVSPALELSEEGVRELLEEMAKPPADTPERRATFDRARAIGELRRSPEPVEWKRDESTPLGRALAHIMSLPVPLRPDLSVEGAEYEAIEAAAYRLGLERAVELVEGEYLTENTGTSDDAAYQQAITDAANAIRAALAATRTEGEP